MSCRFIIRLILLPALLGLVGCDKNTAVPGPGDTSKTNPAALSGQPPTAPEDAAQVVRLTLKGGEFGSGKELRIPFDSSKNRFELLPDGLRITITPSESGTSFQPYLWGFWLFADGMIAEDAEMRCRTGTQLTLNGIAYAPAVLGHSAPASTGHPLDAKVAVHVLDVEKNLFEAELSGTFVAPDGKTPIQVTGDLRLAWPKPLGVQTPTLGAPKPTQP